MLRHGIDSVRSMKPLWDATEDVASWTLGVAVGWLAWCNVSHEASYENWDVLQDVPEQAADQNTMF
jgi:hypothetical protein